MNCLVDMLGCVKMDYWFFFCGGGGRDLENKKIGE